MLDSLLAAAAAEPGVNHLEELQEALGESGLSAAENRRLLVRAWEAAVEGALEDSVITLDEENALVRYLSQFGLNVNDVNGNGVHTNLVQSAVIRDVAQ